LIVKGWFDSILNDCRQRGWECMANLPKLLNRCPLVEANFEIRFDSDIPDDAILGIVYQALRPIIKDIKPTSLPITNLPVEVRRADPNLKFQPHYQLKINDWMISIGPRTLLFSNVHSYVGWEEYKSYIIHALDLILNAGIIKQVNRTGLRYINVINTPLFKDTKVKIGIGDTDLKTEETTIHTTIKTSDGYFIGLNLNNNIKIKINNRPEQVSSLIDIDVYQLQILNSQTFKEKVEAILDNSHSLEKAEFFSLLNPDFLASLGPQY